MNQKYNTTIHAILRDADVLRSTLRDYGHRNGRWISFYRDYLDALSRIPIIHRKHQTIITARPESLPAEAITAFQDLIGSGTVVILWLDHRQTICTVKPHLDTPNLFFADTVGQFDAILNHISTAPDTACDQPVIQAAPLSDAELTALRGIKL